MTAAPQRDDAWAGMNVGWGITATLLAGMLLWGGVGFLFDRLLGTPNVFTASGIILGALGGIAIVYLRYGREDRGHS